MVKFFKRVIKFFKKIAIVLKGIDDPVVICEVYRDKQNGSCAFVDGIHCDVNNCHTRNSYSKNKVHLCGSLE